MKFDRVNFIFRCGGVCGSLAIILDTSRVDHSVVIDRNNDEQ